MKWMRGLLMAALVVPAVAVLALPTMVKEFADVAKVKKGGVLEKAKCAVCHVGMTPKLNPYGKDMKEAMAALKTKKINAEVLKAIEAKDSDEDGVKNGDEIKKDTNPGDPKSK
jgi:mono/diheme cytochrome c family protein